MLWPVIKRGTGEVGFAIMKNTDTTTLSDGDCVVMDTAAAAADLGNAVVGSTVIDAKIGVGVVSGNDILVGQFGWIQVYGVHNNAKGAAGLSAAGIPMSTSATARTLGTALTNSVYGAYMGYTLNAVSAGRVKVFLRCM